LIFKNSLLSLLSRRNREFANQFKSLIGPKTNQQQATNPLRTPGKQDGFLRLLLPAVLIPTSRLPLHKASVPQKTH